MAPVRRQTRQGTAVQEVLRDADGFRSAQEIHSELLSRGHRIGLTTVYRHLNSFAQAGRADVVHRGEGEARFRLCGDRGDGHHHHLVCRTCGRSHEVRGPEVEQWAERVARSAGYTDVTHTAEVFGLCAEHSPARHAAGRPAAPG